MIDSKDMITDNLIEAKKILALLRSSPLNSYKFSRKYFSEYKYRQFKNTVDFALAIEWGIPFVIRTIYTK